MMCHEVDMFSIAHRGASARTMLCALVSMTAFSACADGEDGESRPAPASELLAPPPSGQGVQFTMLTTLEPGQEAEHCQFVQAPPETLFIQRDEVRFTAGSHHVLLYETDYDQVPTHKEDGTPVDTGGVFDCSSGATDGFRVTKMVSASQNGNGDGSLSYPAGIALRVRPSAVLLMNAHYVNPGTESRRPEIRINLHSVPADEVEQEGDILFLYNPLIAVAPGTRSRARMRCPVHRDITLVNAQTHMHRRGIATRASVEGSAPFYETERWEDVPVEHFAEGLQIEAGARLDFHCDYQNDELRSVVQGPRSTDEMCVLFGAYYPADPATSNCVDPGGGIAAEWVGSGTATCKQTLDCMSSGPGDLPALTRCMLEAEPGVAAYTSSALRCALQSSDAGHDCAAEIAACNER
jgi:hypothetical protein